MELINTSPFSCLSNKLSVAKSELPKTTKRDTGSFWLGFASVGVGDGVGASVGLASGDAGGELLGVGVGEGDAAVVGEAEGVPVGDGVGSKDAVWGGYVRLRATPIARGPWRSLCGLNSSGVLSGLLSPQLWSLVISKGD